MGTAKTQAIWCEDDLVRLYKRLRPKGHWFDPDTLRFFESHIHEVRNAGREVRFITSEKPLYGPRRYTVREMSKETGAIKNATEFCVLTHGKALGVL